MVEPLGSITDVNRDGADRPDRRRRGALIRGHRADPPREPPRQFQPSLTGLDRPTLPRQYPDGADEWQGACEVQPVDCVRMVQTLRPVVQTERGVPLIAAPLHSLDGAVPHARPDRTSAGLKSEPLYNQSAGIKPSLAGIRHYKGHENEILR